MGGESFQGLGSGDGVEEGLGAGDRRRGDLGEVGALGEPKAEEAVGVLDGAFLPGGVGVGVVDGGAEDALEGGLVEELAPIVGGHGAARTEGAFGDEAAEGAVDGLLADGAQGAQEDVAGAAFEQDEESAAAATPGDDAVHLPIAKALAGEDFLEKVLNEAVGEMDAHHRPSSLGGVDLLGASLGQEGGILGADPAAMDFVAQQDAGEPGLCPARGFDARGRM